MVLALMASWFGKIVDVKAAFLNGYLDQEKENMYLEIPEGFERFYSIMYTCCY